jgi:hypothetical protein
MRLRKQPNRELVYLAVAVTALFCLTLLLGCA